MAGDVCDHCGSDVNGTLPDGDSHAGFCVTLDDSLYCAYCFRMAHPRLWLRFGGYNMLGSYTITTAASDG